MVIATDLKWFNCQQFIGKNMAIPDFQSVMLPLMRLVAKSGSIRLSDARDAISEAFQLTDQEKSTLIPSGKQSIIYNRVGWAGTYLRKAGLLSLPQRGVMEITDRGKQVLAENPIEINVKFLKRFPEFVEFQSLPADDESDLQKKTITIEESQETPEEILEDAHTLLKRQVLTKIIERIKTSSP